MGEKAVTSSIIRNYTTQNLGLKGRNNYSGDFIASEPAKKLESAQYTTFEHEGPPPKGSMAGVAYHAHAHKWVIAWMSPPVGSVVNRVYVEDGPDGPIDWEVIRRKVESGSDSCVSPGAIAVIRLTDSGPAKLAAVLMDPVDY